MDGSPAFPALPDALGRTLVAVGGGLGDTLLHAGHLSAIAARSAGGRIVLFCKKARDAQVLYAGAPYVERVEPLAHDERRSGFVRILPLARRFRAQRPDTILLLHDSSRLAIAAWLARARRRVALVRKPSLRDALLTHAVTVPEARTDQKLFERADRLLDRLGIAFAHDAARLPAAADALAAVAAAFAQLPRPWIVLGVNSSVVSRQWGGRNFAALVEALEGGTSALGATYFLFGASDVAAEASIVRSAHEARSARIVDLCARGTAFNHAVMDKADFYVGNDSFGVNLAAFCGKPAVVVSGHTRPQPWMTRAVGVNPEPFTGAETPDCTAKIPVARVLRALEPLLAAARTGAA